MLVISGKYFVNGLLCVILIDVLQNLNYCFLLVKEEDEVWKG